MDDLKELETGGVVSLDVQPGKTSIVTLL